MQDILPATDACEDAWRSSGCGFQTGSRGVHRLEVRVRGGFQELNKV